MNHPEEIQRRLSEILAGYLKQCEDAYKNPVTGPELFLGMTNFYSDMLSAFVCQHPMPIRDLDLALNAIRNKVVERIDEVDRRSS